MDNITYDEKYVKIVKRLEQMYGVLVYHCFGDIELSAATNTLIRVG